MAELLWMSSDAAKLPSSVQELAATSVSSVPLAELSKHRPTSSSLLVILPANHLDDAVMRAVGTLADEYPCGVGLLPIFADSVSTNLLLPDDGKAAEALTWGAISAHENKNPLGGDIFPLTDPAVIADRLRAGPQLNIFAGVLNGRQTFVHLDADRLLHPGIPNRICQSPYVVSCQEAHSDHWIIQSCHSPFVWSDFGEYLTVPLAIAKGPHAKSVIASTRVQTYIPRLLEHYADMVLAGCTTGTIVRELNCIAARYACDIDPFLLFGNPDTRITRRKETNAPRVVAQFDAAGNARSISQIVRLLENLSSLVDGPYLNFHGSDDSPRQFKALIHQLRGEFNNRRETLRANRIPPNSLIERWNHFTATNKGRLDQLVNSLAFAWKKGIGYYYHPSDAIEAHYIPFEASLTSYRCASCESILHRRTLAPASVGKTWRANRVQLSCPRCLVVLDASEDLFMSVDISTKRDNDTMQVIVRYQNNSAQPQIVVPIAYWNDPNNLSVRSSRNRELAEGLLHQSDAITVPVELAEVAPGEKIEWASSISEGASLFYCLFEFHLFVDFEWNWFSATLRRPHLSKWLESPDYHNSVDPGARSTV